ncbi:UNVERIFIED_CONTAM: hypothetical protein GTU68_049098 [Idotea baltica]|nr:hypothetical protein [Idotea baltica]
MDATAGLGRDAFLLAALGAEVTLVERSTDVFKMLKENIENAAENDDAIAVIAARMNLIHADAKDVMADLLPEVVLIDPMHPARKKSALVKKEMRDLRDIVGSDDDSGDLVQMALKYASNRVVLKWPQKAEALVGLPKPSHTIPGKTIRYDVFMTASKPSL